MSISRGSSLGKEAQKEQAEMTRKTGDKRVRSLRWLLIFYINDVMVLIV